MKSRNKAVGLAIGERSILVAEVSATGDKPELVHVSEFVYPDGVNLQQPEVLGKALGQYLKEKDITSKAAVVGIPAKWVLTKPKDVPAADPDMIAESLRLQAESEFSPELKDLVYEYAGQPSATEPRSVLLMAIPGRYIESVKALTSAARLTPVAMTPSVTVLGAASAKSNKSPLVLVLGRGGAELSAQYGGSPRALRHFGASTAAAPMLLGELRRAAAHIPGNGAATNGTNGSSRRGLMLWDSIGLDPAARHAIGDALGVNVEEGELATLGVSAPGAGEVGSTRGFASAVSLALAGVDEERLAVDFLHPKLTAPKRQGMDRRVTWGIVAGAAALLLIATALIDYQSKESRISSLQDQFNVIKPQVDAAKKDVDKISFARGWHQEKPRFLACLRDLTDPAVGILDDGQTMLTSFVLHDNMKGVMTGKTTSDKYVLVLLDRLMATKRFTEMKPAFDARDNSRSRSDREITFTINFTYTP
jgi:hypothetical protein